MFASFFIAASLSLNGPWGAERIPSAWETDHPETGTYVRVIHIPAEAEGRRVALALDMVNARAAVSVDGVRAGEIRFPCGEVDLTRFVRANADAAIRLDVSSRPQRDEEEVSNAPDRAVRRKFKMRNRGLTGNAWLRITPREHWIRDVKVAADTATRRLTVTAEGVPAAKRIQVAIETTAGAKVRSFEGEGSALSADWPDVRFWETDSPVLYVARVRLLDSAGAVLNEADPVRFGFRDVKTRGRDLLLNGTPVHLRVLHNQSTRRGDAFSAKTVCLEACRRAKESGFNAFIAGNYSFHEGDVSYLDGMLEACDETGMLYAYSLPHCADFGWALTNAAVAAEYRALAEKAVRFARNHPSVILYAMNHNTCGYIGDMNPMRMDGVWYDDLETRDAIHPAPERRRLHARIAAEIAKAVDPTRPVYHHESGNLGDWITSNCYLNWAPRQERSEWLDHWRAEGVKPLFFVEYGAPHVASFSSYRGPQFIWSCKGFVNSWAMEYAAAVFGDAAYRPDPAIERILRHDQRDWDSGNPFHFHSSDMRRDAAHYAAVQAWYLSDNLRAFRTAGITALTIWDQEDFMLSPKESEQYWTGIGKADAWTPSPVGRVLARWNRPLCAYLGGAPKVTDKRHLYRPGETIGKTLVVLNDSRRPQTVSWTVSNGGDAQTGKSEIPVGGQVRIPISFVAAPVAETNVLKASFTFPSGEVQEDSFAYEVIADVKPGRDCVRLYDPKGLTKAAFDRLGVKYDLVTNRISESVRNGDRIVIGRGALTRELLEGPLMRIAKAGGRVLIFEQDKSTLESLGFRVQEYGLRQGFVRDPRAGLGLSDDTLRDWAGASTLIPPTLEARLPKMEDWKLPKTWWAGFENMRVWRCGNAGAIATVLPEKPTVGDWTALVDGGFDLQYAPLLMRRVEKGALVFCQLDVTGRTTDDPAADELVKALVGGGLPRLPACRRVGIFGLMAHAFAWRNRLHDALYAQAKTPADDCDGFFLSHGGDFPKEIAARVKAGAWVVGAGLTAAEIRAVCPVAPTLVTTNDALFARIAKLPPEFAGLSNGDWAWHGTMAFDAFADPAEDGTAAMRVVRYGKGVYVFMQVAPWDIDDTRRPYLRTSRRRAEFALNRILGNLGARNDESAGAHSMMSLVRYADVPEAEDDPYRFIRW